MQDQNAVDIIGQQKQRRGSLTFQTLFASAKNLQEILHKVRTCECSGEYTGSSLVFFNRVVAQYGDDEGILDKNHLKLVAESPEFVQFGRDLADLRLVGSYLE